MSGAGRGGNMSGAGIPLTGVSGGFVNGRWVPNPNTPAPTFEAPPGPWNYGPTSDWNPTTASGAVKAKKRGILSRLGRGLGRVGKLAGVAGLGVSLLGAGSAISSQGEGGMSSNAGIQSLLSAGGSIAMLFPGIGQIIGGIMLGAAALMDKSVREALVSLGNKIRDGVVNAGNWFGQGLENMVKGAFNQMIGMFNIFKGNQSSGGGAQVPIVGFISGLVNWARSIGISLPGNAQGLNYASSSLRQEALMSGNRPLLVNDREFVIPAGGMAPLASAVSERVNRDAASNQSSSNPHFTITIQLNNPVMIGANKDVINALRQPILDVLDDAWQEVSNATIRRPSVVS